MTPRTLLTAALLLGCIAILQYHAMAFWSDFTGPLGAAWSLLLEGAALWLWSHGKTSRRALGALVTLLMLAGPLYQVSAPLIDEAQRTGNGSVARAERIAAINGEIQTLDRALATYLTNSEKRQGWVGRIDHTQARIEKLRTEQASLTAAGAEPVRMSWQRAAVISMQALAIVIFQLVAVLCIGDLRERQAERTQSNVTNTQINESATASGSPRRTRRTAHGMAAVGFPAATTKPAARAVA